jgi:tape measure domain-containing protein
MTTITALNVRLGMDVSNFSEGANLAKGEVTRVASIMRQSVPPAEKYKQELDLLNRAFSESGKQSAQYANALDHLDKKYQEGKYAVKELSDAQKAQQAAIERGKHLTQSLQTAEEAHAKRMREYQELVRSGAITQETYNRALEQSRKTMVTAQASTDSAIAAAKRLKEEKARLAEAERAHQAVMERGKQVTLSVEKAQETHNRKVREYRELLRAGAIDQETYRRAVERANKTLKESQGPTDGLLSSLKGAAAAYLSFQTVAKSINLASQVEDATIAFEVLTGSAKDGALLFQQIRQFAAESPVTFSGAAEAAKTMMSFGIAAQDVQQNLKMLSDVTGGNNERFKMLALAFSQTSAAGRLMGQDVLQMINAGFNPLQQISKTTGESLIELKKRMEDGGISAQEVRQAFQDATAEGGMFNGMTDRLAQTVSGKLNIALSDLEQKLAAAGEAMGPLVIQLLDASEDLKPLLEDAIKLLGLFAEGTAFALALSQDFEKMKKGQFGFEKTNAFLDRLEARERKAEQDKLDAINAEFEKKNNNVDAAKQAELQAAKEVAAARMKAMEEQKKTMEAAWKEQQKNIEKERKTRLKAIEDAKKAQERAKQQAEEAFQRELESARKAAVDFFNEQAERTKKRREEIAKGPGAGIEVGSAEAVKFAADAVNASIAKKAVPDDPIVFQRDIAVKTAELLLVQREANDIQRQELEMARLQLAELKDNKFTRLR